MAITYEIVTTVNGDSIKRINDDGTATWIPIDEANSDYQRYLEDEAKAK